MESRYGLSDSHTSHQLDVIVPHKVFGHLRPMFWIIVLLEPVTIWKLYLDVCQEVISEDAVSEEFLLHDVLKYC